MAMTTASMVTGDCKICVCCEIAKLSDDRNKTVGDRVAAVMVYMAWRMGGCSGDGSQTITKTQYKPAIKSEQGHKLNTTNSETKLCKG
jgi:hypothetical protein